MPRWTWPVIMLTNDCFDRWYIPDNVTGKPATSAPRITELPTNQNTQEVRNERFLVSTRQDKTMCEFLFLNAVSQLCFRFFYFFIFLFFIKLPTEESVCSTFQVRKTCIAQVVESKCVVAVFEPTACIRLEVDWLWQVRGAAVCRSVDVCLKRGLCLGIPCYSITGCLNC